MIWSNLRHFSKKDHWYSGDAMSQNISSNCSVVVIPDIPPSASGGVELIPRTLLISDWATWLLKFAYYFQKNPSGEANTMVLNFSSLIYRDAGISLCISTSWCCKIKLDGNPASGTAKLIGCFFFHRKYTNASRLHHLQLYSTTVYPIKHGGIIQ